jgi:phenylacetate-coenzyme A ligase PaaK-like adenylate-forming protein
MKSPLENLIIREAKANDRDSLINYQLRKLQETIDYAIENSKFYKDRFKKVYTGKLNSLIDFARMPFTLPKELAGNPYEFLCIPPKYVSRIVTLKTSGTTVADGKRIFFTDHDLNLTVNFFEEGFKAMLSEGDRVMIMMPGESYGSLGDIIKKSLDRLDIKSYIYGILKDCDHAELFVENKSINSIVALPMQAMYLSKKKKELFKKNIKKLMLSADYVPEILIKNFSKNYNAKAFTHYGLTETGYGCAVECDQLKGYHIRENDIYLEIVDPVTGHVLGDGSIGEIVLTTFNREAMPLIRYRTGDYGAFSSAQCKCGTFLKTLERSKGRISNKILINSQYIHMSELDEFFFQYEGLLDYSIKSNDNVIDVKVSLLKDCHDTRDIIKNAFENKYNASINVRVENDESIPLLPNTMIKRTLT